MLIGDVLALQPVDEVREIVRDLATVEDAVDHVAAEQTHLYLVSQVQVDLLVLVDALEYVRCCRTVREFQFVE